MLFCIIVIIKTSSSSSKLLFISLCFKTKVTIAHKLKIIFNASLYFFINSIKYLSVQQSFYHVCVFYGFPKERNLLHWGWPKLRKSVTKKTYVNEVNIVVTKLCLICVTQLSYVTIATNRRNNSLLSTIIMFSWIYISYLWNSLSS